MGTMLWLLLLVSVICGHAIWRWTSVGGFQIWILQNEVKGTKGPKFYPCNSVHFLVKFSGFCTSVSECRFLGLYFLLKWFFSQRASTVEVTEREMASLCAFFYRKSYLKYWNGQEVLLGVSYPRWQYLIWDLHLNTAKSHINLSVIYK